MLYIVIPLFNEEANVLAVLHDLQKTLGKKKYQIIVVDDGSTDKTKKIVEKIQNASIKVVGYTTNMGIGAAFNTGIFEVLNHAQNADSLVIMEGDQTSSLGILPEMIDPINSGKADVVIASRYKSGGSFAHFPLVRKLFSYGASFLMQRIFPISGIEDYTIFFRAYRVGVIKKAYSLFGTFGLIQSRGFVANAELLVKLSFVTERMIEVPFVYDFGLRKGRSKIPAIKTILEYILAILYLKTIHRKIGRGNVL